MAPRTKEVFEIIRQEKKQQIEQAALEVFADQGYHAASIATIAKKAGISKGLIYNYYPSKEELLKSLMFGFFKDMLDIYDVDPGKPTSTFSAQIIDMINKSFDWIKTNKDFLRIYFGIILQPQVLKIIEDEMWSLMGQFFETMAALFAAKGYENPLAEVRYLNSVLDGIFLNYVMEPESYPLEEMKQKIIQQYSS